MNYICGFFAVNNDHCWINGHCVVCKIKEIREYHWYPDTKTVEEAEHNAYVQNTTMKY